MSGVLLTAGALIALVALIAVIVHVCKETDRRWDRIVSGAIADELKDGPETL